VVPISVFLWTFEIPTVVTMKLILWDVPCSGITSHKAIIFNLEVCIKYLLWTFSSKQTFCSKQCSVLKHQYKQQCYNLKPIKNNNALLQEATVTWHVMTRITEFNLVTILINKYCRHLHWSTAEKIKVYRCQYITATKITARFICSNFIWQPTLSAKVSQY
jgi:hypothetical protein